ncbi:beta strand repeat-containing protein, partial [Segetibacter aerophilus]|uniref:beta strand repeat-containing protein n=1 Tax=Segetibacter aerophilus TaxID=670293 RepID=UPI0014794886
LNAVAGTYNFGNTAISGTTTQGILISGSSTIVPTFGTTTVSSGTDGVSIQNNSGNVTFSSLAITTANGMGLLGSNNTGQLIVTNSTGAISATNGAALSLSQASGTSTVNLNFSGLTAGGTATNGVTLTNIAGTINGETGSLVGSGTVFNVSGGNAIITYAGTITKSTAGRLVDIVNRTGNNITLSGALSSTGSSTGINVSGSTGGGTIDFSNASKIFNTAGSNAVTLSTNGTTTINFSNGGLNINTTSGTGFSATGSGTVNITGSANAITATTGTALNLSSVAVGSNAMTFSNITTNTANSAVASSGISLTNVTGTGGSSITINAGAIKGGSTGAAFNVSGGAIPVTYAGTIDQSNTNRAINISGTSGGTTLFSGAVSSTGTSTGINLTSNTGATINFTGGINLNTGANAAFTATGGGTVTVTQNNSTIINTITTTSGTALNIANTTIGASGLTFRSISAGTAVGTAGRGIILDNTGVTAGLTVTGNSSAGTGGTIQHKTGVDITNTALNATADLSTIGGVGIILRNTKSPSFSWLQMNHFDNYGIYGYNVFGFTLDNSIINGTNGSNAGGGYNESSLYFLELTGSCSVSTSNLSGGYANNLWVSNTAGSLNRLTLSSTTIGVASNNDAVQVEGLGSSTVNVTIQNCTFTSAPGDLFQIIADGTGGGDLSITGSNFSNNFPAIATGGGGLSIFGGASGTFTVNMSANTFRDAVGHALLFVKSVGTGNYTATINGNTVGVVGVANSGSLEGDGMKFQHAGSGSLAVNNNTSRFTLNITNNHVRQYNNQGIQIQAGAGIAYSGNIIATISGNTISNPGVNPAIGGVFQGLHLNGGVTPGDNFLICFNVGSNTITGSGRNGGTDFRVRQRQSTTVRLPGYGGANNNDAAVVSFIQGKLVTAATGSALNNVAGGGGGFVGTACQ